MFRRPPREDESEEIRAITVFLMHMDAKLDVLLRTARGDDAEEPD
jgi:hypothetical protein